MPSEGEARVERAGCLHQPIARIAPEAVPAPIDVITDAYRRHRSAPERATLDGLKQRPCDAVQRTETALNNNTQFISQLIATVGREHTLTTARQMRRYCTGFRFGGGAALVVVRPGSLLEYWRVLKICIAAGKIIIQQAANTGLTGGSTPQGGDYDRDTVLISTLRMKRLHVLDGGRQVICFPGTTLHELESRLAPLGREPHSVIGSSCIGASVLGGICNNSGGALVHRGPAFTQLALFAQLDENGELRLVNHLGVRLGEDAEQMLDCLEQQGYTDADVEHDTSRWASDHNYSQHVREVDAETPARFNADPSRLYEASGCAGKIAVFAARLDTFPMERETKVFYIGSNSTQELSHIRRHVLSRFKVLPISGEYIHRDAFNVAEEYGKDTFLMIHWLGTRRLPALYAVKSAVDAFAQRLSFLSSNLSDRILQGLSRVFPDHLPARMKNYRDLYEHHLLLKVSAAGAAEAREFLQGMFPTPTGDYFECTAEEGQKAFLHRFAVAGAAVRYRAVNNDTVEDIVALDIALRRNDAEWFEVLPEDLHGAILGKLYYGHFLCHVFHQDYVVRKGVDCLAVEHRMWKLLDARGAQYPAEHNVGHLYDAPQALEKFYRTLDPRNVFNPGVGRTSKRREWG